MADDDSTDLTDELTKLPDDATKAVTNAIQNVVTTGGEAAQIEQLLPGFAAEEAQEAQPFEAMGAEMENNYQVELARMEEGIEQQDMSDAQQLIEAEHDMDAMDYQIQHPIDATIDDHHDALDQEHHDGGNDWHV